MCEETEKIRICSNHEKEVPLIWTFAFPGAEYWCPYCGFTGGMLGSGELMNSTPELKRSLDEWKEKTKDYLRCKSRFVASSFIFEEKRIVFKELPISEIDRMYKVIEKAELRMDN